MFERDEVVKMIKENVCYVEFEKKDGTLRKMSCTMKPNLLPPMKEKTEEEEQQKAKEKKPNLDVVLVYDLENEAFRSFRLDKLKSVEVV